MSETKYMVTRFCCTSGLCIECHSNMNHGDLSKRRRIVQDRDLTDTQAFKVACGWSAYEAKVEPMPKEVPA